MPIGTHSHVKVLLVGMLLSAGAVATADPPPARADAVSDFYKGRTIDLVISSGAGGGYDAYARALARHLPDHLPGSPTVAPKNMPGGGGLRGANYMFSEAPKDGSVFATIQNGVPFQPLFGIKQAHYDGTKFDWIGSANTEFGVIMVWHTSPARSIDDLRKRQITVAGSGGGASGTVMYYRLLNAYAGTKLKIVTGYTGTADSFLAAQRGEVDGFFLFLSSERAQYGQQLAKKDIRNVVQLALEKSPDMPDVPFARDYIGNERDRQAFDLAVAPLAIGRPYLAPPGIPADRLGALRTGFLATMKDPKFLAEADKLHLEISGVKSGDDVAALVARIYRTPPDVVAKVAEITKN